jgi:hypothetical protein
MVLVVGELSDAGEAGASVVPRWSVAVGGCRLLSVRAEVGGQWRVGVGGWRSGGGRRPATRGWTESDVGGFR